MTGGIKNGSVIGMDELDDYRAISYVAVMKEEVKPGYNF